MPKFKVDKLVRDKIVDNQLASGATPQYRVLDDDEHKTALIHKVIEEAKELLEAAPADIVSELADVQQALDDLAEKHGLTHADVAQAAQAKNDKNGAFKKGHYIESVDLPEDDIWVEYYRRNAERYPEIDL